MQRHFHEELDDLKQKLLTMASLAEAAVQRSIRALVDRNDNLARNAKEDDAPIDRLEKEIDELAIHLLAKAPLATDLRLITTALRIAGDLERVGDEATTISRRALELNQEPQLKPYVDIPKMAEIALSMMRDAIDAFVKRIPEQARAIIPRDKDVDAIHKQLQRELVSYMIEKPSTITRCLNLMVVSKSLERIADHAKNLAEEVVYICEAEDIRHPAAGPVAAVA